MTLCGVGGYKNIQSEAPEMILARQVMKTKKKKLNAFHAHHGLFHYTISMLLESERDCIGGMFVLLYDVSFYAFLE